MQSIDLETPWGVLTGVSAYSMQAAIGLMEAIVTTITLRRANNNGLIGFKSAFWSKLAVFPPSLPAPEHLPGISAWKISVVHQILTHPIEVGPKQVTLRASMTYADVVQASRDLFPQQKSSYELWNG